MANFWEYGFLQRALIAGLFLSVTAGLLSPFIVLRRLSFSADGLAHASLGGLATGMFLSNAGPTPTLGSYAISFLFTCGVAAAIACFTGGKRVQSDTAIGVCYVTAFSLGVILLSFGQHRTGHLEHFFFGSILAVNPLECALLAALAASVLAFVLSRWQWLGQWTFDDELAQASGVAVGRVRYGTILLVAATVILATRVVGVLLVTALLIIPGAVGSLLSTSVRGITVVALFAAVISVVSGLLASNAADVPPGPAMVIVLFAFFVVAFAFRQARERRRPRLPQTQEGFIP